MADFAAHQDTFRERDIGLVAISGDDREDAERMIEETEIRFPVVYGVDVPADARRLGAYYHPEKSYFHATAAIVERGEVETVVYSSGAVGRLTAEEALAWIGHKRGS